MKLNEEEKKIRLEERRQKKYSETHKLIAGVDYKICNKCNEWLPSDDEYFYKNKLNGIDGLYPYCIKCAKKDATKWRLENTERYNEISRNRNKKEVAKETFRRNNERLNNEGYFNEYRRNNKDKLKKYGEKRRQNKKHDITHEEWENCKNHFNYRCSYCGLPVEEHYRLHYGEMKQFDLHKEHVNDNGANDLSNCVPACQSCNSQKHVSTLEGWYNEKNKKFTQERLDKIHKWLEEDYLNYKE